jgi:AAA15 family ATPase/GTPase
MIIQFSFENYKTFKEKSTLSLLASNYDKDTNEARSVTPLSKRGLRVLKSAVIFGPNASGKSKFIDAIAFFKSFIIGSSKSTQEGDEIDVQPFLLNTDSQKNPSEFEIVFYFTGIIYRYGFEVTRNEVIAEWLYYRPAKKEIELFYRTEQSVEFHATRLSKAAPLIAEGLIRSNSLLLSVLAQFNDSNAINILNYFRSVNCISGLHEQNFKNSSMQKVKDDPSKRKQIIELLKSADLGIQSIRYEDLYDTADEKMKASLGRIKELYSQNDPHLLSSIRTTHQIFDNENRPAGFAEFSMGLEESHGTQKYFYFTGLILDALEAGMILVVDELDSKLHPNLVCKIVSLFNSEVTNPNNAQLIFNTHDTNLLNSGLFRRDQIWFISKNHYGASKMYSLSDFKTDTVRKNESFEDNYIKGKYGAIPYLNEFEDVTRQILKHNG